MNNLIIGKTCFLNKEAFSFSGGKSYIVNAGTEVIIENIVIMENKEKEYHVKTLKKELKCVVDSKSLSSYNLIEQEKMELEEETTFVQELSSLKLNLSKRDALELFDALKDGVFSGFGSRNVSNQEAHKEGFSSAIEFLRTHKAVDEHTWNRSGLILQGKLRKMREDL